MNYLCMWNIYATYSGNVRQGKILVNYYVIGQMNSSAKGY